MFRAGLTVAAVVGAVAGLSCYRPSYENCEVACGPAPELACPQGLSCTNGHCGDSCAAPDATPIDAAPDGTPVDAGPCLWTYTPANFDPCGSGSAGDDRLPSGSGAFAIGSGSSIAIQTDGSAAVAACSYTFEGNTVCLLRYSSLTIGSGGTLSVKGSVPLLLVVDGDAQVLGTIDATAAVSHTSPECIAVAGGSGGGGGGGGGFGFAGGNGGAPGGGSGGSASAGTLAPLTNACPGAAGGSGTAATGGRGAAAGGTIQISALGELVIAGAIVADGAGGSGGLGSGGGGGGGGAGGGILLEGSGVSLGSAALLCAVGGGGGGSGSGTAGTKGVLCTAGNGGKTAGSVTGGSGGATGSGGNAGAGGGGGGAAGAIHLHGATTGSAAAIVPPAL